MATKKKKKNNKNKPSKKTIGLRGVLLAIVAIILSMLYLSSAMLFFIGMLPTIVAYFTDDKPGKNKTFTIGAINFSACFHYLINIWISADPVEAATTYLGDPLTVMVIYSAAALGYILNYVSTILMSSVLQKKSYARIEKLESQKKKLEKRWGKKVNGERTLDSNGFLVSDFDDKEKA